MEWPLGGDGRPGPEVAPGRRLQVVGAGGQTDVFILEEKRGSNSLQGSV